MLRVVIEELAALVSLAAFLAMVALWTGVASGVI